MVLPYPYGSIGEKMKELQFEHVKELKLGQAESL